MSVYVYQHRGRTIEREFPIGKAPQRVGKYVRVYTMPVVRNLSPLDRGDRPSVSRQFPKFYGFGQRETCWKEKMEQLGVEDTPHRRRQVMQAGMGPKPKEIERRTKLAAAKAGALDRFDKHGNVLARTKRGVYDNIARAKDRGDDVGWN